MSEVKNYTMILNEESLPILKYIAEEMPGGFFIYHADGNEELIYCNKAMLRIFGCDTMEEFKELTGNSFKGIVHPQDYEQVEKSIWQQISQSSYDLDYVEYRIIQKNGNIRTIQDYGHFRKTQQYGDIFFVFIDDATERIRKRIEDLEEINMQLQNAYIREFQYKKAILYDAISFVEINVTKNEFMTMPVQVVNGQIKNLFEVMKYPKFTKYSEYIDYWLAHADLENEEACKNFFSVKQLMQCYEIGELEQTFQSRVIDIFGRKRLYRYIFLLGKNENNNDIFALFITKDITEQVEKQKLFEMTLRQANVANIARQTFLSDMSHDIRTPLNSIIGFTQLIQSHKYSEDKLYDYIKKIQQSSDQLLKIVTESLEVTRMESGKAVLSEVLCNISEIMDSLEKLFAPEFAKKDIAFYVKKDDVRHANIVGDIVRIHEMIGQLIDNALKYTHKGGTVVLSVKELEQYSKNMGNFQFRVWDNGVGISQAFQKHLFEPFEREYNSTSSGVFGSGLGLVVVKNILDMMGGTIEVESNVGKGSVFTITIPLTLQKTPNNGKDTKHSALNLKQLKGIRVLLVEDNEINMEIAQELLQDCGFITDKAENGLIALNKVEGSPSGTYNVILMDIQMPVMNGYEATRAIRKLKDSKKANIPIIAVSANAFAEDQEASRICGMNAHCPKPLDIGYLKEIIGQVLLK